MDKRIPRNAEELEDFFRRTGDTAIETKSLSPKDLYRLKSDNDVVCRGSFITTKYVNGIEREIARRVVELMNAKGGFPKLSYSEVSSFIEKYEELESKERGIKFKLAPEQEEAVHKAANAQFFVLTGGPGTGKTCVLKCIKYVMESIMPGCKIHFTAPTGKAARRITESLDGVSASTVQKLMHLTSETAMPMPIYGDCVVVDEVSMLDTLTADAFVSAVKDGVKVILVGDVDQLPSVGYGSVLRDLIESFEIPCVKLMAPQRQDSRSVLFQNITNLRYGQHELFEGDDFHIIKDDGKSGQKLLIEQYLEAVKRWGIDDVCCLTPYRRKGDTCANVVNDIIQKIVNDPAGVPHITTSICEDDNELSKATKRNVTFCLGDPVMQLVNREEIANGDVGKISEVTDEYIVVDYGDVSVSYCFEELSQLNLAYAMSVHKSQGSEYKCVITLALPEHREFMCRNLLYTAVTRAKKECVVICDEETVKLGLARQAGQERITTLCDLVGHESRKASLLKAIA